MNGRIWNAHVPVPPPGPAPMLGLATPALGTYPVLAVFVSRRPLYGRREKGSLWVWEGQPICFGVFLLFAPAAAPPALLAARSKKAVKDAEIAVTPHNPLEG